MYNQARVVLGLALTVALSYGESGGIQHTIPGWNAALIGGALAGADRLRVALQ